MRIVGVVAMLVTVGCGGPRFEGTWNGTVTQRATCSDGSAARRDIDMHLTATEDDGVVTFVGSVACEKITGTVDDNMVTLFPVTCAPLPGNGFTYTDSIAGGVVIVRGNILEVNAVMSTVLRNTAGAVVLCSGPLTGNLNRE